MTHQASLPSQPTTAAVDDIGVQVADAGHKGMGVFATRAFQTGEIVLSSRQTSVAAERNIYTVQIDWNVHILVDEPAIRINHSYNPNVGVRNNQWGAYDFVALNDIAIGDEICFDYETTESDLTSEFQAACPPPPDRDPQRRGFFGLSAAVRERYGEFIADYLKNVKNPPEEVVS